MSDAAVNARSHDALLVLCQDNDTASLTIMEASEPVRMVLGYDIRWLIGQDFRKYLSQKDRETLEEMMEFSNSGQDFGDACTRISEVEMVCMGDSRLQIKLKVARLATPDGKPWFRVLLHPLNRKSEIEMLLEMLHTNLAGLRQDDPITNLPNRYSTEQYIPVIAKYIASHNLGCCFALARIDRHKKSIARYGEAECWQVLRHVASCCMRAFRNDDIVTMIDDSTLGMFLFGVEDETARIVLSRLRSFVASQRITFGGKSDFSNNVSLVFTMLDMNSDNKILLATEEALRSIDEDARRELIVLNLGN